MKQPIAGLIVHIGEVVEGVPARATNATRKSIWTPPQRHHPQSHRHPLAARRPAQSVGDACAAKGSLVAPDRLRFDFSHPEKVEDEELAAVSAEISGAILQELSRCRREQVA